MTTDQAKEILRFALEGAVKQDLDDDRIKFLALHLLPLPFDRTRGSVHRYVANHKWVSSLEELLDACGLPPDDARAGVKARTELTIAVRDGGQLVPDLRAVSGWAYVAPGQPLPPGAAEAERVAAHGVQSLGALPAPRPEEAFTEEQRRANLVRLGGLARALGAKRSADPPRPARTPRPPSDPAIVEAELRAFEARRAAASGEPS